MVDELADQGDEAVAERVQLRGVVAHDVVDGVGRRAGLAHPRELATREGSLGIRMSKPAPVPSCADRRRTAVSDGWMLSAVR